MISYLYGYIASIEQKSGYKVVSCRIKSVLGFDLFMPNSFEDRVGAWRPLYVHSHFNDNLSCFDLYGFETRAERELFLNVWRNVKGVGPKTALAIVSKGSDAIKLAVHERDVEFFTGINKIGPKTAESLLNSLSKLDIFD